MPFDPFRGNGDGSSLEQEDPISGATKQAAKAVNSQTQQQVKAANQSFVDQLYGNVSSSEAPDGSESTPPTSSNPTPTAAPQSGLMQAVNPSEQSKLDDTRRELAELQKLHNEKYFEPTFGEEAQRKQQEEEEQERQLKEQEEEEKLQLEEEEKARMDESLQAFSQGNKGKGPDQLSAPIAVTQAKTKAESNRGTSG
jgi:hypothetical protein